MKLQLTVDNLRMIHWWVGASHLTHEDCKEHTGAMMSLDKGAALSFSRKHKLNTKSSTESELVGPNDAIQDILWARMFIEGQGYTVDINIVYQDNKSTILLAVNGRFSSSKRTKHICARYFLVKDLIARDEMEVRHESTTRMWSDVLTKPLQGQGFRVENFFS